MRSKTMRKNSIILLSIFVLGCASTPGTEKKELTPEDKCVIKLINESFDGVVEPRIMANQIELIKFHCKNIHS